tara:strand:- start:579 stop:1181 length:603 start_codon:yes stop_codon:yes gene_type:complete
MPSKSAEKAIVAISNAKKLRVTSPDAQRVRPDRTTQQLYLHASLAASVAAWDAYLNNIIREYYSEIVIPGNQSFIALKQVTQKFADTSLTKFNTPNFENSRTLLVTCTGYDPYGDWIWSRRSFSVLQVHDKLNEILKVRHSFAHGLNIPKYDWTETPKGKVRLTVAAVTEVEALLIHLVKETDSGLQKYIQATFAIALPW